MGNTKLSKQLPISSLVMLRCWGGELVYGSICRFELGKKIDDDGLTIGSSTLWIDADNWIIKQNNREIASSNEIAVDSFYQVITHFLNQKLKSIEKNKNKIKISFEKTLEIIISIDETPEFDLMTLFMPDGQIVYGRDNLYLSGQKSEVRSQIWKKSPLKLPIDNEQKIKNSGLNLQNKFTLIINSMKLANNNIRDNYV